MKTKLQYYNDGYNAAFSRRIVFAANAKRSWQKKVFMQGYRAGEVYLEGQAILNGFDCKWKYQEYLIKQCILLQECRQGKDWKPGKATVYSFNC